MSSAEQKGPSAERAVPGKSPRGGSTEPGGSEVGALSLVRTATLGLLLTLAISAIVLLVVSAVGLLGSFLVDCGIVSLDEITQVPSVVTVVLFGSLLIAVLVCFAVDYTFARPMRRMTAAMEQLAAGNFSLRVRNASRFRMREVDDFARSFNRAAEELGSIETMRAGFISDFSHEFRTPINSLSGFAQLLRDGDPTPEEREEYLSVIIEESRRLAGLSERILTLSKMEAARILPDVSPVDLAEQLRRAALLAEAKGAARGVTVEVNADECAVAGNADYLMQLWTNLLDNAVKFSPEGGVVSVALYGGRRGEEDRAREGDEAVVWVSDEGGGMDEATRARVFDKFYQGETSRASEGSGLGLSICKRIVELHDGSIECQSSPGKGTVFEVRLPLR